MKKRSIWLWLIALVSLNALAVAQTQAPVQLVAFSCQGSGFVKQCHNGAHPVTVIQASDGNFYGVTAASSVGKSNAPGGTIFKLTPARGFTLLHTFTPNGNQYPNGSQPGLLAEGLDGNLYGTTFAGGSQNVGVLYRIAKDGTGFRVLHSFCSSQGCADGSLASGVTAGADGNIYGATSLGGMPCSGTGGCGTIFEFEIKSGSYRVLHALSGNDGFQPTAFILASDGNFYGADVGGDTDGSIYRVTPAGDFSLVITIPGLVLPLTALTQGPDGDLYGLAGAGVGGNLPALFAVALDGSNLRRFDPPNLPQGLNLLQLLADGNGNLWASTGNGGDHNDGMLVELSAVDGSAMQTVSFAGINGQSPASPLIKARDGSLVGTTWLGGAPQTAAGGAEGVVFTLHTNLLSTAGSMSK